MMDEQTKRAHDATDFLIESAAEIAAAKADMVKAENMLRVVKSMSMKSSGQNSVSAQEREAYCSAQYKDAIETLRVATLDYEKLRAQREGAKARIAFWQSLNANQRAAEKGYGSAA